MYYLLSYLYNFPRNKATFKSPPQFFKALGVGSGIAHGMLDIPVPQIVLNQPGIRTLVGQRKTAGMAQHVRMRWQGQSRFFAIASQQGPEGLAGEGSASGTQKQRLTVQNRRPWGPLRKRNLKHVKLLRTAAAADIRSV
jgi:hypothetical protein